MKIELTASSKRQTCWRCKTLGLPDDGIAEWEEHLLIKIPTGDKRACIDCFGRLKKEIEQAGEPEL